MKAIVKNVTNSVIVLSLLAILLGVVLIVHSVINVVDMPVVKKNAKEVEKLILEKKQAIENAFSGEPEADVSEG